MAPLRTQLATGYEISQIITGLWQVADIEKEGKQLDQDQAAKTLVDYATEGFDTCDMADHDGSAELIAGCARKILQPIHAVRVLRFRQNSIPSGAQSRD